MDKSARRGNYNDGRAEQSESDNKNINNEITVFFECPRDIKLMWKVGTFAESICAMCRQRGWPVHGEWIDAGFEVQIQGGDLELLQQQIDAIACTAQQMHSGLRVVLKVQRATEMPDPATEPIRFGLGLSPRLTKRLLMTLPAGAYVVSNRWGGDCGPVFAAQIPTDRVDRLNLWVLTRQVGADGFVCRVVWSEEDFTLLCGDIGSKGAEQSDHLFLRQKLTLGLLRSLPEGTPIRSNIIGIFNERVPAPRDVQRLWNHAKAVGAAGRLCDVDLRGSEAGNV